MVTPEHARAPRRAGSLYSLALLATLTTTCTPAAPSADHTEVESVNPQGLAWVAPLERTEVARGEPVYLTVYTANPAARAVHFTVDGVEVGVCHPPDPGPHGPGRVPETTPDDDPQASLEHARADGPPAADPSDPTNVYPPDPELDNGEEPEDEPADVAVNTVPASPADEDDVVEDEVVDEEEAHVIDPGEGNDCLVNNTGSWATRFDAAGTHTLGAWFDGPDGRRVETTRTVTVVDTAPASPPTEEGPNDPVGAPFDDPNAARSATDSVVDAVVAVHDPRSLPFHRAFEGGREWAVSDHLVVFRRGQLMGSVRTITRCMNLFGSSFRRYESEASLASLVANAYAQSRCTRDGRPGLSGISGAECVALADMRNTETNRRECLVRLSDSPDFAISLAARKIARLRREHRGDPPRIAAALRAGAVRRSSQRPWAMRASQRFITRFVQGYNAFWTWMRNPRRRPNDARDRRIPDCSREPGTRAGREVEFPGSGGTIAGLRSRIQHVILMTQENHSFDSMFGHTPREGSDRLPRGYTNRDPDGDVVRPFHLRTGCPLSPRHSIHSAESQWDFGRMRGFAEFGGSHNRAMGFYTDRDHPFYTWLFETFASSDRYFSSRLGHTAINRSYMYAGRDMEREPPHPRSLLNLLDDAGVPWVNYGIPGHKFLMESWPDDRRRRMSELLAILRGEPGAPTLPPAVFARVVASEHPAGGGDLHQGEQLMREVVLALFQSPYWASTALIINYDEGGGFHDHAPPVLACAPGGGVERVGFRVPLYIVSPYARRDGRARARGYLSHRPHDHASVLRFFEARFDLPALTRRDANDDALLDMFDFNQTPLPAPAAASVPAHAPLDSRCTHRTQR